MDPLFGNARVDLGRFYVSLGNSKRAEVMFRESLKMTPGNVDANRHYASLLEKEVCQVLCIPCNFVCIMSLSVYLCLFFYRSLFLSVSAYLCLSLFSFIQYVHSDQYWIIIGLLQDLKGYSFI